MTDYPRPQLSIADRDRGKTPNFGLNLVRAVAIILVIISHTFPEGGLTTKQKDIINILFLSYNAALFFIISGALLLPISGSYRKFLSKHLLKIWIPFTVWSMVYIILSRVYIHTNDWFFFFQMRWFWMRITFGAGWFIPAITALYLMYPVISPWIKTASKRQLEYFLLLWGAAGLMPYIGLVIGQVNYSLSFLGTFYGMMGFAVAGYYFMNYPFNGSSLRRKVVLLALGTLGGLVLPFIFLQWDYRSDVSDVLNLSESIGSIALGCMVFMFLSQVKTLGKIFNWLVKLLAVNSFGMYLCHSIFSYFLPEFICTDLRYSWWTMPLTIVASLIFSMLIRKIPYIGRFICG